MIENTLCEQRGKEIQALFPELDLKNNFDALDRKYYQTMFRAGVYIWGTGTIAKKVIDELLGLNVIAFIDNFRTSETYDYGTKGVPIIDPLSIKEGVYIIIASSYYDDIKKQLDTSGKREYLDYISYSYLYPRPTELVNKLLFSPVVTDWKCLDAYQTVRLEPDGSCSFCVCSPWVEFSQGNAFLQSFSNINSSIITKLFRYSIVSGQYCFCNTEKCSGLKRKIGSYGNENTHYAKVRVDQSRNLKKAIVSFDLTCNLYCESCRERHIFDSKEKLEFLKEYFVKNVMPYTNNVFCAGQGEVFFSKYYQEIVSYKINNGIVILSNGILADEKKLEDLSIKVDGKISYMISIDAAREETYRKLRRGGDFNKLVINLLDMGKMVNLGKAKALMMNFVISKKNYQEILEFVDLGKKVGATALLFTKIANWGIFKEDEFEKISVFNNNDEPKNEELSFIIKKLNTVKNMEIFFLDEWGAMQYIFNTLD